MNTETIKLGGIKNFHYKGELDYLTDLGALRNVRNGDMYIVRYQGVQGKVPLDGVYIFSNHHWVEIISDDDGKTLSEEEEESIKRYLSHMNTRWAEYWYNTSNKPDRRFNVSDMAEVLTLIDMAIRHKLPSGHFSDYECSLYSEIECLLRKHKLIEYDL